MPDTMTVGQLMAKLAEYPADALVFLTDADTGWSVEFGPEDFEVDEDGALYIGHQDYSRIGQIEEPEQASAPETWGAGIVADAVLTEVTMGGFGATQTYVFDEPVMVPKGSSIQCSMPIDGKIQATVYRTVSPAADEPPLSLHAGHLKPPSE